VVTKILSRYHVLLALCLPVDGSAVATRQIMILLVTAIERSVECAEALRKATGQSVAIQPNLLAATTRLRSESFEAVVFEQHLIEREPQELDIAFAHLEGAVSVVVNLAVTGMDRLIGEVQAALRRRICEQTAARKIAGASVRDELNGTVMELLQRLDVVVQASDISVEAAENIRSARELTHRLRSQLAPVV